MVVSAFSEIEFFLLILFSIILPASIYGYMMWKKVISRGAVLMFGITLIAIAGVCVFLLQRLKVIAAASPSFIDDKMFSSEISLALYLLPALFAGVGVNVISHLLISHLEKAEKQFDQENPKQS
jgi:hypothetical protein